MCDEPSLTRGVGSSVRSSITRPGRDEEDEGTEMYHGPSGPRSYLRFPLSLLKNTKDYQVQVYPG